MKASNTFFKCVLYMTFPNSPPLGNNISPNRADRLECPCSWHVNTSCLNPAEGEGEGRTVADLTGFMHTNKTILIPVDRSLFMPDVTPRSTFPKTVETFLHVCLFFRGRSLSVYQKGPFQSFKVNVQHYRTFRKLS